MRVPQRSDGLVVVIGGRPDVGDHDSLAVPPQRVLQNPRQLGVSVRYMRTVLGERRDHVTQTGQCLVDARGLSQSLSPRARLALPLAACQVHQVQLAHPATQTDNTNVLC